MLQFVRTRDLPLHIPTCTISVGSLLLQFVPSRVPPHKTPGPPARDDGNSQVALSMPCRDASRHLFFLCRGRSLLFTCWTPPPSMVFVTSCLFTNMFGPMLEVPHKPYTSPTKASHVGGSQGHASSERLEASKAKSHPIKTKPPTAKATHASQPSDK